MGKQIGAADTARVKAWLKGHGHTAAKVDKIKAVDIKRGVLELHGVSDNEYKRAGGD